MKKFAFILFYAAIALSLWCVIGKNNSLNAPPVINFFNGDLYGYFYPIYKYTAESLISGNLPLWNPYQSCGAPLIATHSGGFFYPLNILYLIFPIHIAMGISNVAHILLAGLFMFFYCRVIGLSNISGAMAGCTFMLSGAVFSSFNHSSVITNVTWIPLIFVCIERLFERRTLRWGVALGGVICIQYLSGFMQYFIYTLYAVITYIAYRMILTAYTERSGSSLARIILILTCGAIFCILLSAVQLFPNIELMTSSNRSVKGLSWTMVTFFLSETPVNFLNNHILTYKNVSFGALNLISFVAACVAILNREKISHTLFFLFVAVMSVMLSFGENSFLFRYFYELPTGNWFRGLSRFLFLFCFSASVLCGIGVHYIEKTAKSNRRYHKAMIILFMIVISSILAIQTEASARHIITLALLIMAIVVLFSVNISGNAINKWCFIAFIICLMMINAYYGLAISHGSSFLNFRHPSFDTSLANNTEIADFIKERQGLHRSFIVKYNNLVNPKGNFSEKFGMLNKIFVINDIESYVFQRSAEYNAIINQNKDTLGIGFPYTGDLKIDKYDKNIHLIDLMSTKFIIVNPGAEFTGASPQNASSKELHRFKKIYEQGGFQIFENQYALPRAYFVCDATVRKEPHQALHALIAPHFNPYTTVVLEDDSAPSFYNQPCKATDQHVSIMRYKPHHVEIDVLTKAPGYLVITDTYYPGWKVTVDGREEKILRANYLFRAVFLEPGRHVVDYVYSPRMFYYGLASSLLALIFASIVMCRIFFTKKK